MFGTHLHNPLYDLVYSGATFAWVLFGLAVVAGVCLLWQRQHSTRTSSLVFAYAAAMGVAAFELTTVQNTDPTIATIEPVGSFSGESKTVTLWTHTSLLTVLLVLGCVGLLGWYAFHAITNRRILTSATLIVLILTTLAVAAEVLQYRYDVLSPNYEMFTGLGDDVWDVLAVAIVACALVVLVVMSRRGPKYLKVRRIAAAKTAVPASQLA